MSLYEKINYVAPPRFISGRIVEYDIKSANINILRKYHIIDEARYEYLSKLPKFDREKTVGLMIMTGKIQYSDIANGIKESKRLFFEANNIQDNQVVRIANDAVYVNTLTDLPYTIFDGIEFRVKSVSTSFLNLNKILIFLSTENGILNINDVIGIANEYIPMHMKLLSFIGNIMSLLEWGNGEDAIRIIMDFYKDYVSKQLDIDYYREFNDRSAFKIVQDITPVGNMKDYWVPYVDKLDDIDINCNLALIRELYSIAFNTIHIRR